MRPRHNVHSSRKLLVISYHFPPDAAVGAVRPAKFVKYLRRIGWNPYVLTVRETYAPVKDESRLADLGGLRVVRTVVWPTVLDLALRFKPARKKAPVQPSASAAPGPVRESVMTRVTRYANSFFELPDRQIGWLIPAVIEARRLIRREQIDLVVTSSPPRTTALVGLVLSYLAPIRLVTDLRDPWFTPYGRDTWFTSVSFVAAARTTIRECIEQWLERKIMERSARVIVTTERLAVALRQTYRHLPADRICTITNGYDADDLPSASVADADTPAKFTISYLGTLYLHRSPRSIFQALSELTRDGVISPGEIAVHLVGDVRSTIDGSVDDLIASYGLADCVRMMPAVSHAESHQRMAASDLLLLFQPHQYCSVPAKAFEYLAMRKPILCLAHPGATADMIESTHAGIVADPEDVGAIKSAVMTYLDRFRSGDSLTNGTDISKYDRRALAGQLSQVLRDIRPDRTPSTTPIRERAPAGHLKLHRGYGLLTLAYMGVITLVSQRPEFATDPTARLPSLVADLLHIPAYAGLAYCVFKTAQGSWPLGQRSWMVLALPLLVTAVFGAANEWGQLFVPGRYASLDDFFLDVVGMLGSALVVWALRRRAARPRLHASDYL